jgi:hypothetical protein
MWIDQYKTLEDINFNTIDINKVMQDAKSIEIELESMKSAITQYDGGLKDKLTNILQPILDLNDNLFIEGIRYSGTYISFNIRMKIIGIEKDSSTYMTEANLARLAFFFKTEKDSTSSNTLQIETDSSVTGTFRKSQEVDRIDYYHKKYKIVSAFTNLMTGVFNNYDILEKEILFELKSLVIMTNDSVEKLNISIYETLNTKQNFINRIIKEHAFYKLINQALIDFVEVSTRNEQIKITKITPSGKTVEFTRRWLVGKNMYGHNEKMLVRIFRSTYDI